MGSILTGGLKAHTERATGAHGGKGRCARPRLIPQSRVWVTAGTPCGLGSVLKLTE